MTLNELILRDLNLNRREKECVAAPQRYQTMADYDREVRRRLWRRRARAAGEVLGAIAVFFGLIAICWLCCACSGYHWE